MKGEIYTPAIKRDAEFLGITNLQAYRNARDREVILRRNVNVCRWK